MRPLALLLAAAAGCAPDLGSSTPPRVVVATNDPFATPPAIPRPNDLALDPATGRPAIPEAPGATPAQRELDAYLRGLDGWRRGSIASAAFSDAIDPDSVAPSTIARAGSIVLFDLTARTILGPSEYRLSVAADGKSFAAAPTAPWRLGHRYGVLVFGGDDIDGVRARDGSKRVVADELTFFVRSARPLLTLCDEERPACACPFDPARGAFDPRCAPAFGLTAAQAARLEPARRDLDALLPALIAASGGVRKRENLILFWTFTIASGPFVPLGAEPERAPFPSDLFFNRAAGRVSLPIPDGASDGRKALLAGLNRLDGFSTTGSVLVPVDTADGLAPKNATPGQTVVLLHRAGADRQPTIAVAPQLTNGRDYDGWLAIRPEQPLLGEGQVYLAAVTRGITDDAGRRLLPSTEMRFALARAPLYDASTKRSNVAELDDAEAARLEAIRAGFEADGVFSALERAGVPRDELAMVATFRTQSLARTLADVAAYPAEKGLPTDVEIVDARDPKGALGPSVGRVVHGRLHTHVALGGDGTLALAGGRTADVPFLMTLPAAPPQGGAPVAIVQHGFSGWRGAARPLAEAFAKKGWATIAIDVNFHGARAACTRKEECASNGVCAANGECSTSLLVACTEDAHCNPGGRCTRMTGACSNGLAPDSALCMTWTEGGRDVTGCNPAASGSKFLNPLNPFAVRDNLRQHVLDLAQLARVIASADPAGLAAQLDALSPPAPIDRSRIGFAGSSLGGIEGALWLAVAPEPIPAVLSTPGGRLVDLFAGSRTFEGFLGAVLATQGVSADTGEASRLANLLRWVLDPGDPINFARHVADEPLPNVARKRVIVQEAGADGVVGNALTEALARALGLPFVAGRPAVSATLAGNPGQGERLVPTFFPDAAHNLLLSPGLGTASAQLQAATWIASDGRLITAP